MNQDKSKTGSLRDHRCLWLEEGEGAAGSGWTSPEAPGEESLGPNREGPVYKEAIRTYVWEVLELSLTCLRRKFELVGLAARRDGVEMAPRYQWCRPRTFSCNGLKKICCKLSFLRLCTLYLLFLNKFF